MLIDSFYMNGTGGDINLIFRSAGQVVTTDDDGQSWTEQEDVFIVQWEGKTSYCSGYAARRFSNEAEARAYFEAEKEIVSIVSNGVGKGSMVGK